MVRVGHRGMAGASVALQFAGSFCQAHRGLSPIWTGRKFHDEPSRDGSYHMSYSESLFENYTKNWLTEVKIVMAPNQGLRDRL